jgi:hypothetical protein
MMREDCERRASDQYKIHRKGRQVDWKDQTLLRQLQLVHAKRRSNSTGWTFDYRSVEKLTEAFQKVQQVNAPFCSSESSQNNGCKLTYWQARP